jgi:hypothetical protein
MGTSKESVNSIQKQLLTTFGDIKIFAIKTGIVLIGIFILANSLLPDFSQFNYQLTKFQDNLKRFETPVGKLVLLSFVQNPQALLKVSEIEEAEGKFDDAIRETELAIGLLEMHRADKQVIEKYSDRVSKLLSKKLNITVTPAQNRS